MELISVLIKEGSANWACIGDFNEVLTQTKKQGGCPVSANKNFWLRFFLDEVQGVDIGFTGNLFTWCNKRGGNTNIRERLDRVISSTDWRITFSNAGATHLNAYQSDHAPILLNLNLDHPKLPRPFRFQEAWIRDPTCSNVIATAWRDNMNQFRRLPIGKRISNTARALSAWNREHFGFCKERILECERRIQQLQSLPPTDDNIAQERMA